MFKSELRYIEINLKKLKILKSRKFLRLWSISNLACIEVSLKWLNYYYFNSDQLVNIQYSLYMLKLLSSYILPLSISVLLNKMCLFRSLTFSQISWFSINMFKFDHENTQYYRVSNNRLLSSNIWSPIYFRHFEFTNLDDESNRYKKLAMISRNFGSDIEYISYKGVKCRYPVY